MSGSAPAVPRLSDGIDLAARQEPSKPAVAGLRQKLADLIRG